MNASLKRIILDISDLNKSPIEDIIYYPCEENILKGEALIFGPKNTPYQYGNYIFYFEFTQEYPYKPPVVKFKSNDGQTRFNPNYYRNEKVCLSILNTWAGESWSACQSIRSILIILQMTLNENPLINEPGINEKSHYNSIQKYNRIIEYRNIQQNILRYILDSKTIPSLNASLKNDIKDYFNKNKENIINIINYHKQQSYNNSIISLLNIYNLKCLLNYDELDKIMNEDIKN